ncbi:MAG: cation diffusion facilitator family transporter [Marinobacter sp.]|uniref:cation diffusion facilitator family transporter n=1 Tax=Marinobacter sp. TaxID=50741 RepID=UPI00299D0D75|nr:cation diffusion facilitator family transporter [Marinobacter sp.]MDX1633824.1 cation diffusion facilitator family transporter [Marinobacter sp.]
MHAHDHNDGHGHDHSHHFQAHNRSFAIAVLLNTLFVVIEAVYGVLSGSLALLADAGHNLSDVMGLVMAWVASWLANRAATISKTYGLKKTTILAALFNALILIAAVGGITWEAIQRLANPAEVAGLTVVVVAGIGVLINGATMLLFVKGQQGDINIRGAFLHMAADTAVSVGVVISGLILMFTGQAWIDPVVSLVVAAVVFVGTWQLLKDSVNLAVDAVPKGINLAEVQQRLESLPGVSSAHHLHIWAVSTTENALTVHLVKPDPVGDDALISEASEMLAREFRIHHTTIQWERGGEVCPTVTHC